MSNGWWKIEDFDITKGLMDFEIEEMVNNPELGFEPYGTFDKHGTWVRPNEGVRVPSEDIEYGSLASVNGDGFVGVFDPYNNKTIIVGDNQIEAVKR